MRPSLVNQNKDGDTKSLEDGTPVIGDYTGNTKAGTSGYEVVSTTQEVKAGATIAKTNYSYTGGDGESAVLGESANDMTDTVTLDATYAASKEIGIKNGNADSFSGENYTWTYEGKTFHLNSDGDELLDEYGATQTPSAGSDMETAFNAMKLAFTTDSGKVDSAKSTTASQWADEQDNFAKANDVYSADSTTIGNLDTRWATVGTATTAYTTAQGKQTEAQGKLTTDHGLWSDAGALYNAPIYGTIDGEIDAALAEGGAINTAVSTGIQTLVDTTVDNLKNDQLGWDLKASPDEDGSFAKTVKTEAKTVVGAINENKGSIDDLTEYVGQHSGDGIEATGLTKLVEDNASEITTLIGGESITGSVKNTVKTAVDALANGAVKTNTDAITKLNGNAETEGSVAYGDAVTLSSAKAYADDQDAVTLSSAKSYADAGDAKLQSAIDANRNDIAMLDSKMNDLDENLSAGIASSVALSSVAVANVQKGELSVGGGYGNYNSKSAMAFGAALGISDNWSANAGVGFGFGKDTKASVRVGTNYKFKLF